MRKIFSVFVLFLLLITSQPLLAAPAGFPTLFTTEQSAQEHCPKDIVVWLNIPTLIYHFQGQRWYGNTKSGAYVCEKEADQAGDRPTRNGQ